MRHPVFPFYHSTPKRLGKFLQSLNYANYLDLVQCAMSATVGHDVHVANLFISVHFRATSPPRGGCQDHSIRMFYVLVTACRLVHQLLLSPYNINFAHFKHAAASAPDPQRSQCRSF